MDWQYVLGLGANIYRKAPPHHTIAQAIDRIEGEAIEIVARSRMIASRPIGPGRRDFANAAILVETNLSPPALLGIVKDIERRVGRRPSRRWGDRMLDIDILLWSGGMWAERDILVPHPAFRDRAFVLAPLAEIVPGWRDPVTGLSVRQLHHRLRANSPVDRAGAHP